MKKRATIQNLPIDILSYNDAVKSVLDAIENNKTMQIVTINPEMVMSAQKDEEFKKVVNESELIIADGFGIKLALKFKKINQEQIRGVDFSKTLIELAHKNNYPIAFVGAKDEVVSKLIEKLKNDYPDINIVYSHNGFFEDENLILSELKQASPKILLTALGSPRQEFFNYKSKEILQNCITIGVGGSFDVIAGCVKRAPEIWQKLNLEWLYRTIMQPERFKRIFPTLPIFVIKSIIDSIKK